MYEKSLQNATQIVRDLRDSLKNLQKSKDLSENSEDYALSEDALSEKALKVNFHRP